MTDKSEETVEKHGGWHLDDPDWVVAREAEWEYIKPRIMSAAEFLPRKSWGGLKRFYFTGQGFDEARNTIENNAIAEYCYRWLHPDIVGINAYLSSQAIHYLVGSLHKLCWALRQGAATAGPEIYGLMGVREQQIYAMINPGLDYLIKVDGLLPPCTTPYGVITDLLTAVEKELRCHKKNSAASDWKTGYYAHRAELILWDHLSFAMDKYPHYVYKQRSTPRRPIRWENSEVVKYYEVEKVQLNDRLLQVLISFLTFFDRKPSDGALQREHTCEYVRGLVARFEKRDFSPALIEHWDKAKGSLK